MNQIHKQGSGGKKPAGSKTSAKNRGAAIRSQKRNSDDADKVINQYADASKKTLKRANFIVDESDKLKLTFLGGLDEVGEKNMAVIEYRDQAIILDCGFHLGI